MGLRKLLVQVAALTLTCGVAAAQSDEPTPKLSAKTAHAKRTAPGKSEKNEAAEAAPCPRGTWKDDPVCFGEGEKDALPTPSVSSVSSGAPSGASIKPTATLNPRPPGPGGGVYQPGVIYQSNGNAVTSNYGGGVKLDLPF